MTKPQPFSWFGAFIVGWSLLGLAMILAGAVVAGLDGAWGYTALFIGFALAFACYIFWLTGRSFVRQRPERE